MGWKFDQPLYCLSDEQEQKEIIELWEKEKHGGISEGNNRFPMPLVALCALIVLTAFLITQPIWGQRPNAAIYTDFVAMMDSPEVQRLATAEEKMKFLTQHAMSKATGRTPGDIDRHPLVWLDLLNIAPQIKEVQAGGGQYDLASYNVLGNRIQLANFEGNIINGVRERKQPFFDLGYAIDLFYVSYFTILMIIVIKQLPHYSRKPDMSKAP